MKKHILIIALNLLCFWSLGQETELIDFIPSACDQNEDVLRIRNRISEIYLQNDTLFVTIGIVANCGYADASIGADAKYTNDTLYLSFDFIPRIVDTIVENGDTSYLAIVDSYLECDCCFEFQFLIKNIPSDSIPIILNDKLVRFHNEKYKTYPVKFEIVNGDTINFRDKYGLKQDRWLIYNRRNQLIMDRFYKNDKIIYGSDYKYYDNDTIKTRLDWQDGEYLKYVEFDEKGVIQVEKKSPFDD